MASLGSTFKFLLEIIKRKPYSIDNFVFRLHYRFTTSLVLCLSAILWCKQFFGEPIQCISSVIDKQVLDTYCWIHSTFTNPTIRQPYFGVGLVTDEDEKTYHAYYQWVFLFLLFQGSCFYLPNYIWKSTESGTLANLLLNLNKHVIEDEGARQKNVKTLARFLYKSLGQHRTYAFAYCFCELLNTLNVIIQMYLTNLFLGGAFTTYGIQVVKFSLEVFHMNITDPTIRVFPRMTMCTFYRHGLGGSVEQHDSLCVLPLNVINDKLFIFLWFWFIILLVLNGIVVIYRVMLIIFKKLRYHVTLKNNRFVDKSELQRVAIMMDFGSWFLLNILSKNLSAINFVELIHEYTEILDDIMLVLKSEV